MPRLPNLATMLEGWNNYILEWALLLAAVATMTMALLELLKALLGVRPLYHRSRVSTWLASEKGAFDEMMNLAIGGGGTKNALFDQPTNKMMGQIQAAANTALDFPQRYPVLYAFLTAQPGTKHGTPDEELWKQFCAMVEQGVRIDAEDRTDAAEVSAASRARARLDHFVARRLDAFQTVTEYRWARINQFLSVAGATAFLLVLMEQNSADVTWKMALTAIFGGMIAPLAKDVVTALGDLRVRRT